ncbi:MAG: outer membrane protein assembly factor BamE [Gammaproteobacteria bacterium]|nr:MAG: outer membrane protein assembly factor BamE [Gammaproteobacteria bacterium]
MKLASRFLLVTLCVLSLTSCKWFPSVHKLNIQQGHIITADMVNQLKLGMSKRQVRFVLGNTLLPDTFNDDRWDYFYSLKVGRTGNYVKHLYTVYFENDKLVKMEGDYLPGKAPLSEDKAEKYLEDAKSNMPLPTNIEKKPEPVIDQPK